MVDNGQFTVTASNVKLALRWIIVMVDNGRFTLTVSDSKLALR